MESGIYVICFFRSGFRVVVAGRSEGWLCVSWSGGDDDAATGGEGTGFGLIQLPFFVGSSRVVFSFSFCGFEMYVNWILIRIDKATKLSIR